MSRKQLNIQELFQRMGSKEHPGDIEHRYELRRTLLCSRFFDGESAKVSRWDRMLSYTAPLVAGGMMVGVFALIAVSAPIEAEVGPQTISGMSVSQATPIPTAEVTPLRVEDFLSDPMEPNVSLAGFGIKNSTSFEYIPFAPQVYVRMQ